MGTRLLKARLEEAPLWVHEGICQQAAAELCRRRNYADTLFGIEHGPKGGDAGVAVFDAIGVVGGGDGVDL